MLRTWQKLKAKDGTAVSIRPLTKDDAPYLVTIFAHMSSDSRYRRFNQPMDDLTEARIWQEAKAIVATMPPDFGWLAFVENEPIGAIRYVGLDPDVAEFAISLADEWQGLGIGTQLVLALLEEARQQGLQTIIAVVQSTNKPMLAILNKLSYLTEKRIEGTETTFEISLNQCAWHR